MPLLFLASEAAAFVTATTIDVNGGEFGSCGAERCSGSLRDEWRGQDGQSETGQPDHSASSGDSITSSNSDKAFGTHRWSSCLTNATGWTTRGANRRSHREHEASCDGCRLRRLFDGLQVLRSADGRGEREAYPVAHAWCRIPTAGMAQVMTFQLHAMSAFTICTSGCSHPI